MKKLFMLAFFVTAVSLALSFGLCDKAEAAYIINSGSCGTGVTYTLDIEGVLTISGNGAMKNYYYTSSLNAPWHSYGSQIKTVVISNGVTSIGEYAFYLCSLTSISIPESVTSIGNYAFHRSGLASISIPDGVEKVGSSAFQGCFNLSNVSIGRGVTEIESSLFSGCSSLTSVTIPDGVTSIGWYAFYDCSSLTSVTIPDNVTSIGRYAFSGCSGLTSAMIPDSLTSIGDYAFSGCDSLSLIVYGGSEEEWSEVNIGTNNDPILNTEIRYNSTLAFDPAENELTVKQEEAENDSVYTFSVMPEKLANNCFVYAAAYGENGNTKKMISLSKAELLTSGESKINVSKDDGVKYVIVYVLTEDLKPISQIKKVEI